jgi:hypothetical protein
LALTVESILSILTQNANKKINQLRIKTQLNAYQDQSVILYNGFLKIHWMETLLKRENYFSNIIFLENIQSTPLEESYDSFLNNPSSKL